MAMKKRSKILLGILAILVILSILAALFGGVIIKKIITGTIRNKTGVEANLDDLSKGNLSYTDPKTGQTLNIGTNKIPDNFPKDFPIYPGSTVTSSLSGNTNQNGIWLTLVTSDSLEKVSSFYETSLKESGWTLVTSSPNNWTVSKGTISGYLTLEKTDDKTSILIVLKD